MIISLTNKCLSECSHCMVDATPDGPVMDDITLKNTIKFINKLSLSIILISGGEITDHPNFYNFIKQIINDCNNSKFVLLSNGLFIKDKKKISMIKQLLENHDNILNLQIRTHERYYPNYNFIMSNKQNLLSINNKIQFYNDGINLLHMGRAKKNFQNEGLDKLPSCGNLFLLSKQKAVNNFKELLMYNQFRLNKFCKPYISCSGNIYAGESSQCVMIGNITDSFEKLFNNLKLLIPCNKCNGINNLSDEIKLVINKSI